AALVARDHEAGLPGSRVLMSVQRGALVQGSLIAALLVAASSGAIWLARDWIAPRWQVIAFVPNAESNASGAILLDRTSGYTWSLCGNATMWCPIQRIDSAIQR